MIFHLENYKSIFWQSEYILQITAYFTNTVLQFYVISYPFLGFISIIFELLSLFGLSKNLTWIAFQISFCKLFQST